MTMCVGCGCTDLQACPGGCTWLAVFDDDTGVCSSCPEALEEIQAQEAEFEEGRPSRDLILPGDPEFDVRLAGRRRG